MAAHRASFERQTGRTLPGGAGREFPFALSHVWEWFLELAGRRTNGGLGPNPLTHAEVMAWTWLTDRQPKPWEVRLLFRMDDAMLQTLRQSMPKPAPVKR